MKFLLVDLALLVVCLGILGFPKLSFGNSIQNQLEKPIRSARTANNGSNDDDGSATPVFIAGPLSSLIFLCCLGFCCYRCCCRRTVVVAPTSGGSNLISQVTVVAPPPAAPAPAPVQPIFVMPPSAMMPQFQNQGQTSYQNPASAAGGEPPKYYP